MSAVSPLAGGWALKEDEFVSPAAGRLALAAPAEWAEFKTAFTKYANSKLKQLAESSLEELQRSQGRAQQCNTLALLFEDAVNAANRISARAGSKQAPKP